MDKLELKNILEFSYEVQLDTRNWRNSPQVTKYFQIEYIDEETHKNYLSKLKNNPDKFIAFVILHQNNPCGLVYLSNINSRSCDWGMYIHRQDLRGQGIGSKVITETLNYAKDVLKVKEVNLEVLEENKNAISLYEKSGFIYKHNKTIIKYGVETTVLCFSKEF